MKIRILLAALLALTIARSLPAAEPKPLKVLLITGGCCHDYAKQRLVLKEGIEARTYAVVEMVHTDDKTTKATFNIYEKSDWAVGYDVVIHDECTSEVKEMPYVRNILDAHKGGVPAVNLHCAMHCYRTGTPDWFEFCGIQSSAHGPQKPIAVTFVDREHPVTKPLSDWNTINEELYNNIKVFETAKPLARGRQEYTDKKGVDKVDEYVVAWANEYGKTRVFSTTLGHNTDTVADARYLDLVTRGMLWACDKLNDEYLKTK